MAERRNKSIAKTRRAEGMKEEVGGEGEIREGDRDRTGQKKKKSREKKDVQKGKVGKRRYACVFVWVCV